MDTEIKNGSEEELVCLYVIKMSRKTCVCVFAFVCVCTRIN